MLPLLKPGVGHPPIFLAHGIGADLRQFDPLLKHLEPGRPIYGLQAGAALERAALESIEETAQVYLPAIRWVQPEGPYLLIGYSFGGLVMYEIAQRLSAIGQFVGLLAMIDSYPHPSRLSLTQRVSLAVHVAGRRASKALSPLFMARPSNVAAHVAGSHSEPGPEFSALRKYKPNRYGGEVKFIRAGIRTTFPANAASVWKPIVKSLDVVTVPGDHVNLLTEYSASLASVLNRFVSGTLACQP